MVCDTRTCSVDPSGAMHRLPTFKKASVCALASSGFYYVRDTFLIKCESCGQEFYIFTTKENPSIKIYHKELCPSNKSWNSNSSDCFENGNELGDEADSITNSKTDSSLSQPLTNAIVEVMQVGASKLSSDKRTPSTPSILLNGFAKECPHDAQQSHLANNVVRKVLLYAADTCPGSSGAPVIAFQRKTYSNGSRKYALDIWMHNGVDATNNLGASIMKVLLRVYLLRPPDDLSLKPLAYTKDDFNSDSVAPQSSSTNQTHQEHNSDDDGTRNLEVTSPVFKILTPPSYPVYIAFQKRLESFVVWNYGNIHTPSSLASAGFFYAGYGDCVRCFQRGLGLRSWKPGDDVYVEHRKNRPSCPFLKLRTKLGQDNVKSHGGENAVPIKASPNVTAVSTEVSLQKSEHKKMKKQVTSKVCNTSQAQDSPQKMESLNDQRENLVLKVLKAENKKLRKDLTSKMVSPAPIRNLFLPCGELYKFGPLQKRSALKSRPRRHKTTVWFGGMKQGYR